MIRPITTAGGFRLASKAGITDIAEQAEEFIADKPHYSTFINLCISQETTPIFEWCSRKNRIVIDYPEDQLILTAIRYNNTGAYVEHESMKRSASLLNIPVVKAIDGIATQNIHLLVHQIREWDDGEGVVMRFDDGHMVKIKADDYVLRHKSKEAISQEKNVIATIVNDEVDDLIPLLTEEDAKRILAFQKAFWLQVDDTAFEFAEVFNYGDMRYPDRKDFAVKYVQGIGSSVPPKLVPFMFKMRSGTGAREAIIQVIQKSVSSQTKIDENRWLFGNLQWNQPV
jgi:RNA ligase